MNALNDLGHFKQQWQSQQPARQDVAELRERVAVDTRANQRVLIAASLITGVIVGLTLLRALRSDRPDRWFSFAFIAVFTALVWAVAMWLSRGTWKPRDESLAAHLEVSIRRCRSLILAAPVGIVLYFAGLATSLLWKQRLLGMEWGELLESPSMVFAGWIGAPLYTIAVAWNARRQQRRLNFLLNLRRQLGES
jgi:hypothetical protein